MYSCEHQYVCVDLNVCMYIYIYIYIYIYMYVYSISIRLSMYIHVYMYAYTCIGVCTYGDGLSACMHADACIFIYICMHIYMNTAHCIWRVVSSFSNLNRWSSSPGLFYHVPLKRDQGD